LDEEHPESNSVKASAIALAALIGALLMVVRTPLVKERYKRVDECAGERMVQA
jgi:hypothetical protein